MGGRALPRPCTLVPMRITARFAAVVAALCLLSASGTTQAEDDEQTAEARRLYGEAKKLMGAKQYREAAVAFEAAGRLKTNAVAYYTAAQAWELAADAARAADAYALALATPKLNDAQSSKSEERLTELEKQVGSVKVKGAQGTRVRIDDHMELGAPATLHAGAGEHTLVITRADGSSETRKLAFEAGKSIEVDTGAEPELQPETEKVKRVTLSETRKAPVDEPSTGPSPWKTVGFIGIGAGVAALGGALVLGLSAKDAEDTYKKRPTRETLDHAKGLESSTNIMLVVGGVITAVGVTLVVWPAKKQHKPSADTALSLHLTPTGVSAGARF